MRLAEKDAYGEHLYQCDMCQIVGMRDITIIDESGRHFCMSCWLERDRNRVPRQKAGVFES